MTRRTIPWHRLLPRHQRLLVWWALAGLGIAAPWLIAGVDLPWLQRQASELPGCRVASVYDGDTLRVECGTEKLKVRLHCIDAPEMQQRPWGTESRNHLRAITPRVVSLRIHDTDRYGRKVAEAFAGETNINLEMVRAGQAAVFTRYCSARAYDRAQHDARAAGLGIWSKPGEQQRPWEWRGR
jgi:endonuclease YncB( thermonuclease family)